MAFGSALKHARSPLGVPGLIPSGHAPAIGDAIAPIGRGTSRKIGRGKIPGEALPVHSDDALGYLVVGFLD